MASSEVVAVAEAAAAAAAVAVAVALLFSARRFLRSAAQDVYTSASSKMSPRNAGDCSNSLSCRAVGNRLDRSRRGFTRTSGLHPPAAMRRMG